MKIDLKWLKRYVEIPVDAAALAEIFPRLGLEVRAMTIRGAGFPSTLVVGEIIDIAAHPDADKLRVCKVKVDGGAPQQIVCGAKNFQLGDRVPVALPGTILPNGEKIKAAKLRGILSEGMMCSAHELGISEDHEGLLILKDRPVIGTPFQSLYPVEDVTFELETTSNRGDLLSHRGIARELDAFFKRQPLEPTPSFIYPDSASMPSPCTDFIPVASPFLPAGLPPLSPEGLLPAMRAAASKNESSRFAFLPAAKAANRIPKAIIQSEYAPYYCLFNIHGLHVAESPKWLQRDIRAIGLNPINNVVDITNWVLFDYGQPLHAFDADKVYGDTIYIRQAKDKESVQTLDGTPSSLTESILVVADEQKVLSIAGIMGGKSSAIQQDTHHILLESAYFHPDSIRCSTRVLRLQSDSSYRFERDVDPVTTFDAGQCAAQMILEICGGELVCPPQICGQVPRNHRTITLDPSWMAQRCGCPLSPTTMAEHLTSLGYRIDASQTPWKVTVPSYRSDVSRPVDLVEEFLRIYGNENISISSPSCCVHHRQDTSVATYFREVAYYLCHRGAMECYHYSLRTDQEITSLLGTASQLLKLNNPIVENQSHLRPSLIPGLLDTLRYNLQNKNDLSNLFENGHIFIPYENKLWEAYATACIYPLGSQQRHWDPFKTPPWTGIKATAMAIAKMAHISSEPSFQEGTDLSAMWQEQHRWHLGDIFKDKYRIHIGILDLVWCRSWELPYPIAAVEICFLPQHFDTQPDEPHFQTFSLYPKASRDIALVVDRQNTAEEVRLRIKQLAKNAAGGDFDVEDVMVFDIYEGKELPQGKKNIALAIDFYSDERTLKEQEVQYAFELLQRSIIQETSYEIRCDKDHETDLRTKIQ
ncbi:MAG: phenylalanine--tRNA ligase subunit beta [Puniceicoccales bacterium]|jgi:phenylalanyl-tRNA synthetase beta chain|nr:phenylalanine--tRNA ligase subunit beta [Puniceicoccales bacterium]